MADDNDDDGPSESNHGQTSGNTSDWHSFFYFLFKWPFSGWRNQRQRALTHIHTRNTLAHRLGQTINLLFARPQNVQKQTAAAARRIYGVGPFSFSAHTNTQWDRNYMPHSNKQRRIRYLRAEMATLSSTVFCTVF